MRPQLLDISLDVEERLRGRGFPLRVVYGPERIQRGHYDPLVLLYRDREMGDVVSPAQGVQRNPRKLRTRQIGVVADVFAVSTVAGAMLHNHEEVCDEYVDALIVALEEHATSHRAGDVEFLTGHYLAASDRDDVETWPGVVYRLRFRVGRGVFVRTWAGEALPEGAATQVVSSTQVRAAGRPGDPPEAGC